MIEWRLRLTLIKRSRLFVKQDLAKKEEEKK